MSAWLDDVASEVLRRKQSPGLNLLSEEGLSLRPVTVPAAAGDVASMVEWRNLHPRAFFTWFEAREEATQRWLEETYSQAPLDLMVMLINQHTGQAWGHLALSAFNDQDRSCELGRVLRGVSASSPGGMRRAINALLAWANREMGLERVHLEVFESNARAIACYRDCGFQLTERWPLTATQEGANTRWQRAESSAEAEYSAVTMSRTLSG
jgi:RimJ/RimL family protein N-acetyltransferase